MKGHILITGTGRAGTTFLVQLLTRLGLETGFSFDEINNVDPVTHAGLEIRLKKNPAAPRVIKWPKCVEHANSVLQRDDLWNEHVIVPMRDLFQAAESRRQATEKGRLPGGVWLERDGQTLQEDVLKIKLYALMLSLSRCQVPVTLLEYPKLVRDSRYLHRKLAAVIGEVPEVEFQKLFEATVKPEWVHDYAPSSKGSAS